MEHNQEDLSEHYSSFSEDISEKRLNSTNLIRRKVHNLMYDSVLSEISPGLSVIDVGCGDGTLISRISDENCLKVGLDVSVKNIEMASSRLEVGTKFKNIQYFVADATNTQVPNRGYEQSISHHVLEHLSSFGDGLNELKRITETKIIIAIPTAWSPLAWPLLGGGTYWVHGRSGLLRMTFGLLRTLISFVLGKVGVDEKSYSSLEDVPHIFFFPKRIRKTLECEDWKVTKQKAQVIGLPWIIRSIKLGERDNSQVGLGTVFVLERRKKNC